MKTTTWYEILIGCLTALMLFTAPWPDLAAKTIEPDDTGVIAVGSTTVEVMKPDTDIPSPELPETTIEETTIETDQVETESETTIETEPVVDETVTVETKPSYTRPELDEPYITFTDEEKRILATLIRLEAGGASYECQMAVGSVVLNRMAAWNKSLEKVVFQKNQFSPAYLINRKYKNGEYVYKPYDICWEVVDDLCENGPTIPYYVLYFRAGHHHKWAIPYCEMDGTYFSYLKRDK